MSETMGLLLVRTLRASQNELTDIEMDLSFDTYASHARHKEPFASCQPT